MNIWSKKIRNLIFVIIMPKNIKLAHFFFFFLCWWLQASWIFSFLFLIIIVYWIYCFLCINCTSSFLLIDRNFLVETLWITLKPQIYTRTTMIYFQAKLKGSLSKNPLIYHFFYRSNDLTQQNWQKELPFGQNKNMNEV